MTVPPAFDLLDGVSVPSHWIDDFDCAARLMVPGMAPELNRKAATWAAVMLARICQLIVTRDAGADVISRALREPCPEPGSSSVHYSVDLFLRYFSEVFIPAQKLAPGDPLIAELLKLGAAWPLSSIGIAGVEPTDLEPVISSPCLLQLYADRVIQKEDCARLKDLRIAEAVRSALGDHPELAPAVAAELSLPQVN
jgi:hypothetical protein